MVVYKKPKASSVSILKQMKASGIKPQAGQSLASLAGGFMGAIGKVGQIVGVPGAGLLTAGAEVLGAVGGVARAGPRGPRKTYTVQVIGGRIVTSDGRNIGLTRKKAKKQFGRRRRRRWTTRDSMEWKYRLACAQASAGQAVIPP